MTYKIQNIQHRPRFAELPSGVVQIPALGEVVAELDADSVQRLFGHGFKLSAAGMPVPKVESMNVVDAADLGATNAGKLNKKSSKPKKDDQLLTDSSPGETGQE